MPRLDGYGVLRQRAYRRFWIGQWISLIGTWMQTAAQGWLLIQLTGSPFMLGLLGAAASAPLLVFVLLGGVASDRVNRRRLILFTQMLSLVQALTLALLTLGGHIQPWQVIGLAAVLGTINAFDVPARQAFVVELVGPESVGNAIALNSSAFNIARVIGPALGGLIVAAVGEGYCFLLNAVSYIAVIWTLATIRPAFAVPARPHAEGLTAIADGLRYVWRHDAIRPILLLVGVISSVGVPYRNFLPAMARTVLGANAWQYGLLIAAAGVGASSGGLVLAAFRVGRDAYRRLLPITVMVFSIMLLLYSAMRSFWPALGMLTLVGVGGILYFNSTNSLIQLQVEDRYRGRVMSVYTLMHQGTATFGNLLLGVVAAQWGTPWALASGALVCLIAASAFMVRARAEAVPALAAGTATD
ncbi:MAG: MFS transporter [Deltaproteobacteria bacterium]|nr:MFS transporter [Deltaproteobacteria bacterium]MBI3389549.1 MFS transporter [Deltaproteobacteria bacterium]